MKVGILETGKLPDELNRKHGDYPAMFKRLLWSAAPDLDFAVYHVTENQLPARVDECDAWLITGSRHGVYDPLPWIDPLKRFLKQVYDAGIPMVGICFGHQVLAEALGGKAEKSDKGWGVGVQQYKVHKKPHWMTGIDGEFSLTALHQDQVTELPADAEVLAGSGFCPYGLLVYGGNAMSMQPHPEFSTDYARDIIEYRRKAAIPDSEADAALVTLDLPMHTRQAAEWIVGFMKDRLAERRKVS